MNKKEGFEQYVFELEEDLKNISDKFNLSKKTSLFQNTGIIIKNKVYTIKTIPNYSGPQTTLRDILINDKDVPKEFFIDITYNIAIIIYIDNSSCNYFLILANFWLNFCHFLKRGCFFSNHS